MDWRPCPWMVMARRFEQLRKADAGIDVTEAGIVTRTARVCPEKTSFVNSVTGFPSIEEGIVRVVVSNETAVMVDPE